jgi:hypothetical protein
MLRITAVVLLLMMLTAGIHAGEPLYVPHGAGEMGLAFATSALPGHWSCFHNQALLTQQDRTSVSAAMETRFMLPAFSSKAVSAVVSTAAAPLGFIITHYGNGDYQRIFSGISSAVTISPGFALGIQVNYITERGAGDYRDVSHVTFETGVTAVITSDLTIGLHLQNPVPSLNSLASSINAALAWKQSDAFSLSAEFSKVTGEPLSIQSGIHWNIMNRLVLRSGYMSSPSAFAFGAGYKSGSLQTDAGCLINSITGITSSVSFTWTIGRRQ